MSGVTPLLKVARKTIRIRNEYVRAALIEFLGTAILCMFAVGAGMQSFFMPSRGSVEQTLGGTLGIMVALAVSGAQINPAVSLGTAVVGRISWIKLPFNWAGQFLGGYVGSGLAVAVYKGIADFRISQLEQGGELNATYRTTINPNVFSPVPSPCSPDIATKFMRNAPIAIGTGILDQILSTSIFLMGILGCLDQLNMKIPKKMFGLSLALMACGISLCFGYNAGAVMNPARDLGPRLMALTIGYKSSDVMQSLDKDGNCQPWWIVGLVGPFIGGVLGCLIYVFMIGSHLDDEKESAHRPARRRDASMKDTGQKSNNLIPNAFASIPRASTSPQYSANDPPGH